MRSPIAVAALCLLLLLAASAGPSRAAERCAYCGGPITGDYLEQDGRAYHRSCWEKHVALRCSVCGGILNGTFLRDSWGNAYHASHRSQVPECEYCGRLISEALTHGGVRYPDGRNVCNLCRRSAVEGAGEGRKILAEAASRIAASSIAVDVSEIRLRLIDSGRMAEISGDSSRSRTGYTRYETITTIGGRSTSETVTVHVLAGMPRVEALATMAHELTHVWMLRAGRLDTSPALAEGSCNYAALTALAGVPGEDAAHVAARMRKSKDPIYGEGMRRVARYVDRNGTTAWLQLVRTRNDFPPGF